MRVVIAGGTGFLGRALTTALERNGDTVALLTRGSNGSPRSASTEIVQWHPDGNTGGWASAIEGAAAVVNLAGESIAAGRWTNERKQRILESRLLATRSLVQAIARAKTPPAVLVSGSAVGYYGPLGDEPAREDHPAGEDFLAGVCEAWEAEAKGARQYTRLVCIRTGLVLERDGGALPKMLPPFWFGVGGPVGSGRQYWPWIHRQDWVNLVRWAIATNTIDGPLNATAPRPVTNAVFAKTLGQVLHRPAFMPAPAFAMKLLLGEMADALLLSGQRAMPAKAERLGFEFVHTELRSALQSLFRA